MDMPTPRRARVLVKGQVQGVGFRPFVWRLATQRRMTGWVRNGGDGVTLDVEGDNLADFLTRLRDEKPTRARIDSVIVEPLPAQGGDGAFRIEDSPQGEALSTAIGPDTTLCSDCLSELFAPANRRYRHPFITCTQCGPRFTLTRALPYDRAQTSMAHFPLCEACTDEYGDPADRRFHAEPIACPDCGPTLAEPIDAILARLQAGQIIALKGLGGFHLVCDARNESAVARLRTHKARDAKPFAVMVANAASARLHAPLSPLEAALLESPERPVVLVRAPHHRLAPSVSAGLPSLGLLLPSTPIHYLLFHDAAGRPAGTAWLEEAQGLALVMTSANISGEPLITQDDDLSLLSLADAIIGHDRAIVTRCDDSVARIVDGKAQLLRRARGYTPAPIKLSGTGASVLALGAHLKTSLCVTRADDAFLSQHVGDLDTAAARHFHAETRTHLLKLLGVSPSLVVHDLHPDMATSQIAATLGLPSLAVQHHHAHIAAVCAEHGYDGPLLGLALDGYGYGPEGEAWGGELLRVDGAQFTALGGLAPLPLPGGDRAAREPWRIAAAFAPSRFADEPQRDAVLALAASPHCPRTSACGRLFDAAAAVFGVRRRNRFEGEAAMALEGLARTARVLSGGWSIDDANCVSLAPLFDVLADASAPDGADLFHGTLAAALADLVLRAAAREDLSTVALGGGCIANALLVGALAGHLRRAGLRVLTPSLVPAGDGGLALGQAWIGRKHLEAPSCA